MCKISSLNMKFFQVTITRKSKSSTYKFGRHSSFAMLTFGDMNGELCNFHVILATLKISSMH